jgi:RNA polymerase sigma factor (sigma-70 family)
MAVSPMNEAIRHVRRSLLLQDGAGMSDGQLLECFVTRRDETAFEILVRRHGPMVMGVCQRILRDPHQAADAFQATFLILVRKAASLASPHLLGNWLYGVAYRIARKAKAETARRWAREKALREVPEPVRSEPNWQRDLLPLLDQELHRLPDKYRLPIVLFDLEGKTRKEAARQLGLPEGTIAGRVARARAMLAKRLARHGIVLSGGCLALHFARKAVSAGVARPLLLATVHAATATVSGAEVAPGLISTNVAALIKGVMKDMFLIRFKMAVTVTIMMVLGLGGGVFVWQSSQAAEKGLSSQLPADAKAAKAKDEDNLKNTLLALEKHRWEATVKGDWEEAYKLHADDYLGVSSYGRNDKDSDAAGTKNLRIGDWSMREVEVRPVSKDVAILTYVYDCQVYSKGGELLQTRKNHRASLVWALRKGGWVIVFCQESILPGGQ